MVAAERRCTSGHARRRHRTPKFGGHWRVDGVGKVRECRTLQRGLGGPPTSSVAVMVMTTPNLLRPMKCLVGFLKSLPASDGYGSIVSTGDVAAGLVVAERRL